MRDSLMRVFTKAARQVWSLPAPAMAFWLFVLGLFLRIALILVSGIHREPINFMEMEKIARSLALENIFGNPYKIPTGPTAHCSPVYPFLLSLIYRSLGFGVMAHFAALAMNAVFASLAHALLPLLANACGLRRQVGFVAGLIGVLIPFRLYTELGGWEAPLTSLCLAGMLLATAYWYRAPFPSKGNAALYGAAWGMVFLAAPNLLLVCVLLVAAPLFWVEPRRRRSLLVSLMIVALSATAIILPWTVRNYARLGGLIFIRSNLGIELATSNFPGASEFVNVNIVVGDPNSYHFRRHPFPNASEAEILKKMGEIDYNKWRVQEAWNWAKANPGQAAGLTLRRCLHFWFMPSKVPKYKDVLLYPMVVLAFFGVITMLRESPPSGWLFASALLGYPAAYYFIQLSTRYRYPMEFCLTFLCVFGVMHLCANRSPGAPLSPSAGVARLRLLGLRVYFSALFFALRTLAAGRVRDGLKLLVAPLGYWRFFPGAVILDQVRRLRPGRVLDVSSPKMLSLLLARHAEVWATDLNDPAIFDRWKPTATALGLERYYVGYEDARRLPYPDGFFDLMYSISVVEHIPGSGDTEALAEFQRVLRPGGLAILEVPFRLQRQEIMQSYDSKGAPLDQPQFYERFYDRAWLDQRLSNDKLELVREWIVGEYLPIDPWIATRRLPRWLRIAILPFEPWLAAVNCWARPDALTGRPLAAIRVFRRS
jgi:SAM-dependent methyltransferase